MCSVEVRYEEAQPLVVLPVGLLAQVFAPAAGLLSIVPSTDAGRAASTACPRISPIRLRARRAGPVTATFKLNREARRLLRARKRLRVTLRMSFTPTGGRRTTRTARIVLRDTAKPRTCRPSRTVRCARRP